MDSARSLRHALAKAGAPPPERLDSLLALFAGGDVEWVHTAEGLHPLVLPIARECSGTILGFLRWPTAPDAMPLPLVRTVGAQLERIARSTDEFLHRELATRDFRGEPLAGLLESCNRSSALYATGSVRRSGLPLNAYLLTQVGVSWSFFEELVEAHLERGDLNAALITAERACQNPESWGRPSAFRAMILHRLGKYAEARDCARAALHEPLWTFGHPIEPVGQMAGWASVEAAIDHYRRLTDDPTRLPLDRAAHRLDVACLEGGYTGSLRQELGLLYSEGGYPRIGAWIHDPI